MQPVGLAVHARSRACPAEDLLHSQALEAAQAQIVALQAQVAVLRGELRAVRGSDAIASDTGDITLLLTACLIEASRAKRGPVKLKVRVLHLASGL